MRLRKTLVLFLSFWVGLSVANFTCIAQTAQNSVYPGDPIEFTRAQELALLAARVLPPEVVYRKLIANRFKQVSELKNLLVSGNHPIADEGQKLAGSIQSLVDEKAKYDESGKKYEAELKRYNQTPITPENSGQMAAWKEQLDKWRDEGIIWQKKLGEEVERLNTWRIELAKRLDKLWQEWIGELQSFIFYAKGGIRLGEIDAELIPLEKQIVIDRNSLDRFRRTLPGFHEEVEQMARQAEETRKAGAEAALGFGLSLAIDSMAINSASKQALSQEKLKETKNILIRMGTPPEKAKSILRNWKGGNAVVTEFKSEKEFIENLSKLVDYGGVAEGALRHKYWETANAILSLFVQTPMLKLVKANAEIWTSLLYTGLSVQQAKARVVQFSKLADSQLQAVKSLTTVYEKHLKKRAKLKAERQKIAVEEGFLDQ